MLLPSKSVNGMQLINDQLQAFNSHYLTCLEIPYETDASIATKGINGLEDTSKGINGLRTGVAARSKTNV